MKRSYILLAVILSIAISIPVFSAQDSPGLQVHDRDRVQSGLQEGEQEQIRSEVNNRIRIDGGAYEQMMLKLQEETQLRLRDLENHWSKEEVERALRWGFVNGYPDETFRPEGIISGTEAILMLSRMMNCLELMETDLEVTDLVDWDKVPQWAREQLREETALRIANQSHLYGESQLNRHQFAVMLSKALGLDKEMPPEGIVVFTDDDLIPQEELGYIYRLRVLGIVQGSDGMFMPQKNLTRAEATAMMNRVMNMLKVQPGEFSIEDNELLVILPGNPTTGFSWDVVFKEGGILRLKDESYTPFVVSAELVGSGGEYAWVFSPDNEGIEEITFKYFRSWEGVEGAIDTRVLTVEVSADLEIVDAR